MSDPEREKKKKGHEMWLEEFKIHGTRLGFELLLGFVVIAGTAVTLFATNFILGDAIKALKILIPWVALSVFVLFYMSLVMVVRLSIAMIAPASVSQTTEELAKNVEVSKENLGQINEALSTSKIIKAQDNILYFHQSPDLALRSFLSTDKLHNEKINEILFVGTCLGVDDEAFNLAEHVKRLLEKRSSNSFGDGYLPFKEFKIVVPAKKVDGAENKTIIGARGFAIKLISYVIEVYKNKNSPLAFKPSINISFQKDKMDVFPCWQMWGGHSFLIMPSVNSEDRKTLPDALPLGIGGEFSINNLSTTQLRLEKYFNSDLYSETPNNERTAFEKWTISKDLKIATCDSFCKDLSPRFIKVIDDENIKDKVKLEKKDDNWRIEISEESPEKTLEILNDLISELEKILDGNE